MKKYLLIFGTRPEALKLFPLIKEIRSRKTINLDVCNTGQHVDLTNELIKFFKIKVDYNFNLMFDHPTLNEITAQIITRINQLHEQNGYDGVIVHGDTITCLAASLSSFLKGVPVFHVEAGLRSNNLSSPWPEEFNRRVTTLAAQLHFAPTLAAKENLLAEGISSSNIFISGNTIIDMLRMTLEDLQLIKHKRNKSKPFKILVTSHRRENFGKPLDNICEAVIDLVKDGSILVTWPIHPNPNVKTKILDKLSEVKGIILTEPQEYIDFVKLMADADLILTDSGGMQEEAPYLSIPVLVLRKETERPEVIACGAAKLVGTNKNDIISSVRRLVDDESKYKKMASAKSPFGDGYSSNFITNILENLHNE
jgi:UDP-N-acetylglucosamine 2-epimerase (non-hydrolysing)